MKLKLSKKENLVIVSYFEYSQRCLNSDPIEIPSRYEDWIKGKKADDIKELLKDYIKK